MPWLQRLLAAITTLSSEQIVLGLAAISALILVLEDRRLLIVPLVAQYVFLPVLAEPVLYRPLIWVRWGLGLAIGLMLFLTATHAQRYQTLREGPPLPSAGVFFRLVSFALCALVAYGVYQAYPIENMSPQANLACYLLMSVGLVMMITGVGPFRAGLGMLVFVSGFGALYVFLEHSLLVIGLLGILDMMLALAVVVCTELWLQARREPGSPLSGQGASE